MRGLLATTFILLLLPFASSTEPALTVIVDGRGDQRPVWIEEVPNGGFVFSPEPRVNEPGIDLIEARYGAVGETFHVEWEVADLSFLAPMDTCPETDGSCGLDHAVYWSTVAMPRHFSLSFDTPSYRSVIIGATEQPNGTWTASIHCWPEWGSSDGCDEDLGLAAVDHEASTVRVAAPLALLGGAPTSVRAQTYAFVVGQPIETNEWTDRAPDASPGVEMPDLP
ncbi:MAG TPA: hypothetical protein VHH36_01165 [Candidatus Thermoplasmatota archaeon]|nr:hypothetical protein [Candidatus Thermoplasmatota archaeon]